MKRHSDFQCVGGLFFQLDMGYGPKPGPDKALRKSACSRENVYETWITHRLLSSFLCGLMMAMSMADGSITL
jgi:hypothetical protein